MIAVHQPAELPVAALLRQDGTTGLCADLYLRGNREMKKARIAHIELLRAVAFAAEKHRNQCRKGAEAFGHAAHLSPNAKLIKLADKISNVREIGYDPPKGWDVKRRQKYFGWAREVVDALGPVNANLEKRFDETLKESSRLLAEEAAKD